MFAKADYSNEPIFTGILDRLPWPDVEIPGYEEVAFGDWRIDNQSDTIIRGYFRGLQPSIDNHRLFRVSTDEVVMSVTPMETESHMPHVAAATGHTVVVGGGMGLVLYNVLKKDSVKRVTLIEIDKHVVDLIEYLATTMRWPGLDKLTIVESDVFDARVKGDVDFLYVDIWPQLMDGNALSDTKRIQDNLKAKVVGFWGQELEFISWMQEHDAQLPPTRKLLRLWLDDIGLPLMVKPVNYYPKLCLAAAEQVVLY
jgi:hypothetical protein